MSGRSPARRAAGFSLIELLAVVGILIVLVTLLFPAVARLMRVTEVRRTQVEVNRIADAIRSYYMECGQFPYPGQPSHWYHNTEANLRTMYERLSDPAQNRARRVFLDLPLDEDGLLRDPWGNFYRVILFDPDKSARIGGDGWAGSGSEVTSTGGQIAVVRSLGPNGVLDPFSASGSDDILSFK